MPVVTKASATSLINCSLTLQPNLFQLFQPIGGVRASSLSSARASIVMSAQTALRQTVARQSLLCLLISCDLCWRAHLRASVLKDDVINDDHALRRRALIAVGGHIQCS